METQILQEVDLLDGVLSRGALKQVHSKLVLDIGLIVSRVLDHRCHICGDVLTVFGVGSMVALGCTPFTPYFEAVHRDEFLDDLVIAGILHLPQYLSFEIPRLLGKRIFAVDVTLGEDYQFLYLGVALALSLGAKDLHHFQLLVLLFLLLFIEFGHQTWREAECFSAHTLFALLELGDKVRCNARETVRVC